MTKLSEDSFVGQINLCALCIVIILPFWVSHLRLRKRQVMSPTMVPTRPVTLLQLLRSQYLLLLLLQLGLLTGTVNVPTLLSLALCNRLVSRTEPLSMTALCTQFTTTYCCFNFAFASSMRNELIIVIILESVPSSVYPPLHGPSWTHRAGGSDWAGGSQESHLTHKQTEETHIQVLLLLLTLFHTHTHFNSQPSMSFTDWSGSIQWCHCGRWFCRLFLLAISIRLPLPTRDQEQDAPREKFSLSEVCARSLDQGEWRKMNQLDSMGLTVATLPIICPFRLIRGFGFPFLAGHFMPFTSGVSIFGNELRISLPCLEWMSIGFALLAHQLWNLPFS